MQHFFFITILFLTCIGSHLLYAQAPRTISYQGILTDNRGNTLPDGTYQLTLRLYDASIGGRVLHEEMTIVQLSSGLFSTELGSIPGELLFDNPYWLAVAVDDGEELNPRTPLTAAPYAMYAERSAIAEGLAPEAQGVVKKVNGLDGELQIEGGGGTTVNRDGNTITISSVLGEGGTGIQGVQNSDGALVISNPNGPVATLNVANASITGAMIADRTIGSADIAAGVIPDVSSLLAHGDEAGGDLEGSYPNPVVAEAAITSSNIKDGTITKDDIADDAITQVKIADNAVGADEIADDAISAYHIADGSIKAADLADGVIPTTLPPSGEAGGDLSGDYPDPEVVKLRGREISDDAPSKFDVLRYDGVVWSPAPDGMTLPFVRTASRPDTLFGVKNTGSGLVMHLETDNSGGGQSTVIVENNGRGRALKVESEGTGGAAYLLQNNSGSIVPALEIYALGSQSAITGSMVGLGDGGRFTIGNPNNTKNALYAKTTGKGKAGHFEVDNSTSNSSAFTVESNAGGSALFVDMTGTGNGGRFRINNANNDNHALTASTNGEGVAINGTNTGTGWAGYFQISNAANRSDALTGITNGSGSAVWGYTTGTGNAGEFIISNNKSTAAALHVETNGKEAALEAETSGTDNAAWFYITNGASTAHTLFTSTKGTGHALYAGGTAYKTAGGNTWAIPSDERLKQDITPFHDGLAVINKVHPVSYRYNGLAGTRTDRVEYGILAQEMERVAPYTVESRMVKVDPTDPNSEEMEILTYNGSPLIYVMINAIQELSRRVDSEGTGNLEETQEELAELRQSNEQLQSRVEELEMILDELRRDINL